MCVMHPIHSYLRSTELIIIYSTGMMDQLASIGLEFDEATIHRIFTRPRLSRRSRVASVYACLRYT